MRTATAFGLWLLAGAVAAVGAFLALREPAAEPPRVADAPLAKAPAEERPRSFESRIRPEDGGLDVLKRVFEERADPMGVLADFDLFASHVRVAQGKTARFPLPSGDAPLVLRASELKDSSTLEFGPGTFTVATERWFPTTSDVTHLEIRGAGKDRTTLVLVRNLLLTAKKIEHLRVHDVSIATPAGMTLIVGDRVAAVFEDVRFLPWQLVGHAAPIGVSGSAYVGLRRCEFFSGGHRPGVAISLNGPALVLAEDCVFADVEAAVAGQSEKAGGSILRFSRCRFLGSPVAESAARTWAGIQIRVSGGEVRLGGKDLSEDERRFLWGAPITASLEDVQFAPDPEATATVGELVEVLERTRGDTPGTVVSVERVAAARMGQPGWCVVYTWEEDQGRPTAFVVRWAAARATASRESVPGGPSVAKKGAADSLRPLSEILRASSLPATTPATGITLQVHDESEGGAQVYVLEARRVKVVLDARTGEVKALNR